MTQKYKISGFKAKLQWKIVLTESFLTFWTDAFEHKIGTMHQITLGQLNLRNGKVFETNGLAAMFAVEVNMHVVVNRMVVAVAEFIAHAITVFKHMDKVMLLEERQTAENARFVNAADAVFQLGH